MQQILNFFVREKKPNTLTPRKYTLTPREQAIYQAREEAERRLQQARAMNERVRKAAGVKSMEDKQMNLRVKLLSGEEISKAQIEDAGYTVDELRSYERNMVDVPGKNHMYRIPAEKLPQGGRRTRKQKQKRRTTRNRRRRTPRKH